tara:strand:+ start:312 stop:1514 length:1203 start_codon:yes stop_codon:yes gene_type:complete
MILFNLLIVFLSFPLMWIFEKFILKKRSIFFYPFTLILLVIVLHAFFELFFDYSILNYRVILLIVYGFFLLSFSTILIPYRYKPSYNHHRVNFEKILILPIFFIIFTSIYLFYLFLIQNGGFDLIELNNEEISSVNNLVFFQIFLTPIIFYSYLKKNTKFLLLLLNFLCLFLTFVKGVVIISVLSIFIYYLEILKLKIKFKYLFFIALSGFFVFICSYLIPIYFLSSDLDIIYFINKFGLYLFAGLDGLSAILSNPAEHVFLPTEILFTPLINFTANLTGYIDNIRVLDFVSTNLVNNGNHNKVNVFTFFGTIFIASGKSISLYSVLIILFGLLTNLFYALSINLRLYYTSISSIIWLTCFYLSFFEFYFWHSFLYYIILFGLGLDFIFYFFKFFIYEKK